MPEPKKESVTVKLEQVPTQNMIGILNDQSIDVLNSTFKEDTPNALRYTVEDYLALTKSYDEGIAYIDTMEYLSIMVCLSYGIQSTSTPQEIYTRLKKRSKESIILRHLIKFLYDTPLYKVPLYINDPNLRLAAKWRLSINK